MSEIRDLAGFFLSSVKRNRSFTSLAVIDPFSDRTVFLRSETRTAEVSARIMAAYETVEEMKDPKSGITAVICEDRFAYVVERTVAASFCDFVQVQGMSAFEESGRLVVPALTLMNSAPETAAERFPWTVAAIRFANRTTSLVDSTDGGYFKYPLSVEVKEAWNEFFDASPGLWCSAPRYEVGWRDILHREDEEPVFSKHPLSVLLDIRKHPKNDPELNLGFRSCRLLNSW